MINTKLYAALDALECQLGVFVTDADIVFLEVRRGLNPLFEAVA